MDQVRRKYEDILRREGKEAAVRFAKGLGAFCIYPEWY